jgi:hypothetical protein
MLVIDWNGKTNYLSFQKEGAAAVAPTAAELVRRIATKAARAGGGKAVEVLAAAGGNPIFDSQPACPLVCDC